MPGLDRPLSITLYDKNTGSAEDIAAQVTNLQLTSVAPGGFGSMKATMRVPERRGAIVPPHLRPFAQVAIMDSDIPLFLGRLDEPGLALSNKTATDGVYFDLSALGASAALGDDPQVTSYIAQTAKQIITDQISGPSGSGTPRSAYLNIDQDTALILPSNPGVTFSPGYDGKTILDVLGELLPQVGDYTWSIVGHQRNRDAAGFPTWQLSCGVRDTTTTHYTGYLADEDSYLIRPAIDWSYNSIQLLYKDINTQARGSVTVIDGRLNGSTHTQGTAPFPYRLLRQDYSNLLMSGAQAAVIANALLAQYQNGGYKIQVLLGQARDAQGNPIPLRQVVAGKNIFLPELMPLWQQLLQPSIVANSNLFYIQQADYQEYDGTQAPILTLTLQTFTDTAAFQLAALQAAMDKTTKSQAVSGTYQTPGVPIIGVLNASAPSNAPSGSIWETPITFPTQAVSTPTINIVTTTTTNITSATAQNITNTGFVFRIVTNTTGSASRFVGSYSTSGN